MTFAGDNRCLLIRADGGPSVGVGHVMRSLAIGEAWQSRGGKVVFVVGNLPGRLIQRVQSCGFYVYKIQNDRGDAADAKDTGEIADAECPGWIFLDGYRFGDSYQQRIKSTNHHLVVMDDYRHADHNQADLIVNQNAYGPDIEYPESTRVLAGSKFAILRSEFLNLPKPARTIPKTARRILVTFGGSDPDNWTSKTLNLLNDIGNRRTVVDCIVGPCFQQTRALETLKKTSQVTIRFHQNVDRMSVLMQRADLAITGGGGTCHELARCGVPSIIVPIADNQKPVAKTLEKLGIAIAFNPDDNKPMAPALTKIIRRLINDPNGRLAMSNKSKQLVDGLGAQRIVNGMLEMQFELRSACQDDARQLLQWRNDPEVRAVSFEDSVIPMKSHIAWLDRKMVDPNCRIWIAADDSGSAVGQIRFDMTTCQSEATVSIILDEKFRGQGIGRLLIASACQKLFDSTDVSLIKALVKPGNVASEKAFRAAGFSAIEPAIVNNKVAHQFVMARHHSNFEMEPIRKSA